MIQHGSVNSRRHFEEIADGELSLMPVSASFEWGEGIDAASSSLSPGVFYRDTAEDHPFFVFTDDDSDEDDDDIEEDDDFDDVEDDFDDDFDDEDDDFDDDEDDDFDDDDEEYDYDEDVDYDDFDE